MINNISRDLHTARKAAQAGARLIRSRYGQPQEVRVKSDSQTLVTETDVAAESAIMQVLNAESRYGILSEESGSTGSAGGPVWVVDPLDGTSNFARSLPFFAVSLALADGNELLTGVIIDPIHDIEYYALKGEGAFCNGKPLKQAKPVNKVSTLFLNHGAYPEDKYKYSELTRLFAVKYNLRKLGTTALELCFVAAGLFDGFICAGDEIWDYAAGALIAAEAGCVFSDWHGRRWDGFNNSILVCRPEIHRTLVRELTTLL